MIKSKFVDRSDFSERNLSEYEKQFLDDLDELCFCETFEYQDQEGFEELVHTEAAREGYFPIDPKNLKESDELFVRSHLTFPARRFWAGSDQSAMDLFGSCKTARELIDQIEEFVDEYGTGEEEG